MYSMLTLPRLPSFRGTSNGPSRISTSDGHPWMSTQYFKFKLITDDSIDVVAKMFLKNMTPEGQLPVRYDFMSAATRSLPYGREGDREMVMVMRIERVVNLYYLDCFDHANGFDFVHVSVSDLVDERTCVKEAITLRYIYTDRFDTYIEDTTRYRRTLDKLVDHRHIQVTHLLSGWEVTDLSRDNFSSRAVTQYYNWDGVRLASRMLNRNKSHQIVNAFINKIFDLD
ncbi:36733_t:CDS:1, partial [Gigaspora margarita]